MSEHEKISEFRKPTSFHLDDPNIQIEEIPLGDDFHDSEGRSEIIDLSVARKFRLSSLIFFSLTGLLSLMGYLIIEELVLALFAKYDWLGWVGIGLIALLVTCLVLLCLKEVVSVWRLRKIEGLQHEFEMAYQTNDPRLSRKASLALVQLYKNRADLATSTKVISSHLGEVMDGRDLINLCETDLMRPIDEEAHRIISRSAKRVSLITAVSPRAIFDIVYVMYECIKMLRQLAYLYHGRPGYFGAWKISGKILSHLAITGGIALSDTLIQQLLGHGVVTKISTKFGEGFLNGFMTLRVGIAIIHICRPVPYLSTPAPQISSFISTILSTRDKAETS